MVTNMRKGIFDAGRASIVLCMLIVPSLVLGTEKLSLQECRQLALDNNEGLRAVEAHAQAAQLNRKAATTQYFPKFDLTGSYTRQSDVPTYSTAGLNLELGTEDIALFSVGVRQPLFTGGKIRNNHKIHQQLEDIAKEKHKLKTEDVIYATDRNYWLVVSMRERVRLAEKYAQMVGEHVETLRNMLEAGIIMDNDILKAKVKLNAAELLLLEARDGVQLSQMALCCVIGLPLDTQIVPRDLLEDDSVDAVDAGSTDSALSQRPEVKMLEANVKAGRSVEAIKRSRYAPQIALWAKYAYLNPSPYNGFEDEFDSAWMAGIVCNFELFHWNERGFELTAAKRERQAAELNLESARKHIALEVKQTQFQVNEALKKTRLTASSLKQAEENLRVTQDRFSEGVLKSTDILDAQVLWQEAYSRHIDAKAAYRLNLSARQKALGILGETERGKR
jgi:outer membrane protein